MHRRIIKYLSLAVAPLMALAACSSSSDDGSKTGDSPVEVTVWHYWDGTNADAFDSLVSKFNEEQDEVVVKTSMIPNTDFLTKLRASATSKSLPDIAIGDLVWVPQINQIGSLADLSKVLPSEVISDINPQLIEYGSIDGKQISVPVSANNLGLLYNRELYREAGLDPDNPPTTWDEVISTGKQIVEKTGKPAYELYTQAGDNGEGLTWQFQVNLWQAGGEFLTEDNSAAAFNTKEGKEALQYWVDLINSGVAAPVAAWGEFSSGRAAAATDGSWMVGIWSADPPFDFGTAKAPYPSDGSPATNLGGEQAMIFENENGTTEAAGKFLSWFLQTDQVTSWSEQTGMLPVTQSVASSDDYLTWVKEKQSKLLPFVEQMSEAHTRPNTPIYPQISLAFAKEIEKALSGSVSVDEALSNAEVAVNEVIANG